MPIDHWMMFGTFAEQRHFVYPSKDTYAGVMINANMVAHAPAGLAGFLLERTGSLPYIIDPMTHAFQHDTKFVSNADGNVKSSILRLSEYYGLPVSNTVGKRPILPKDFNDDEVLGGFVQRSLDFQSQLLVSEMEKSSVIKYLLDDDGNVPHTLRPTALVAPYFYLTEVSFDQWLPIMVRAAQLAIDHGKGRSVFGSIVISQGVLADESLRTRLVVEMTRTQLNGFLVWIDDFNELAASRNELNALLELAKGLREAGADQVINLHGGYFSVLSSGLLQNQSFSGVTHGPEFGEFRSVVPVGGGIPIARYYVPQLHSRVRYQDVLNIFNKKSWLDSSTSFHAAVCDCAKCIEVINGDIRNFELFGESNVREIRRGTGIVRIAYPTADAKLRCLSHYLQRKSIEYQFAATATNDQLIADLENGARELEDVIGIEGVAHLLQWKSVLENRLGHY